ncbi:MAG: hypothetical protein AAGI24_09010 [Pseudomonadota bacterium]
MPISGLNVNPWRRCLSIALILLAGCADYQFTVNDKVVYRPAPLFTGYEITDPALRACVTQHIEDQGITDAEALRDLNCSHAGIHNLTGLDVFASLERLKLSDNNIEDAAALAVLPALRELGLDQNRLLRADALLGLQTLEFLDLRANPGLACSAIRALRSRAPLKILPPDQCRVDSGSS